MCDRFDRNPLSLCNLRLCSLRRSPNLNNKTTTKAKSSMAHSRLERIGTIYTRITGLIKSGAMKLEDRPIWYEVYEAFPPETPPLYSQKVSDKPIRDIFYPEDKIRALFHKKLSNFQMGRLDDESHQTLSQKCVSSSLALSKENGISLEEAFETAFAKLQDELAKNKTVNVETQASSSTPTEKLGKSVDLKDIFKED
ncbi:probable 28S ribosomal protein S23, mitochondrial [Cimex lectularius]|uniref:Small ribosomal subunit protein mS23 n=1 Tax=Cimex lectularius TaxID=79782 RepID=A0A8I6RHZ6_CIMLE|nr:probable 28S ribosomal protein S23, mitochondrial [Cimex lectularius]